MEEKEFIEECRRQFNLNGLECSEEQAKKLFLLTKRMLEVNKSMNLTAIKEEKAVILRHYVDSLTISKYISEGSKLLDVGCGAGFPTLPLAIFRPDVDIVAMDGTAKRIRYVDETARILELDNVTAISERAEELAFDPNYRECFNIVTARAVAALPVLCELCLPFVKVGGSMIGMKSQQADAELTDSMNCIKLCGGKLTDRKTVFITDGSIEPEVRNLIFIEKTSSTPKIYPRHFSKISKKHL